MILQVAIVGVALVVTALALSAPLTPISRDYTAELMYNSEPFLSGNVTSDLAQISSPPSLPTIDLSLGSGRGSAGILGVYGDGGPAQLIVVDGNSSRSQPLYLNVTSFVAIGTPSPIDLVGENAAYSIVAGANPDQITVGLSEIFDFGYPVLNLEGTQSRPVDVRVDMSSLPGAKISITLRNPVVLIPDQPSPTSFVGTTYVNSSRFSHVIWTYSTESQSIRMIRGNVTFRSFNSRMNNVLGEVKSSEGIVKSVLAGNGFHAEGKSMRIEAVPLDPIQHGRQLNINFESAWIFDVSRGSYLDSYRETNETLQAVAPSAVALLSFGIFMGERRGEKTRRVPPKRRRRIDRSKVPPRDKP